MSIKRTADADRLKKSNDDIVENILSNVDPDDVMAMAIDVAEENVLTMALDKLLALVDLRLYDMDNVFDVEHLKQALLKNKDYGLTPATVDAYVDEHFSGEEVVLEQLSTHMVFAGAPGNQGWDLYCENCRAVTQDDVRKVIQIMRRSGMWTEFVNHVMACMNARLGED
jgi:hypothetical protein